MSTFFFIFTLNSFFGELTGVNRQIIAEFFLMLSIFLWLDKHLPIKEKRILLVIFGAAIALSHYSIAIIYAAFVIIVVVISSFRPKFDETFNSPTVLAILGITFLWDAFSAGSNINSTLTLIINTIQNTMAELTNFHPYASGVAGSMYSLPEAYTISTYANLALSGLATLALVFGIVVAVLFLNRTAITNKYKLITVLAAIVLAMSYVFPSIAATLNFTRFYAITMLFLALCFPIGALLILRLLRAVTTRTGLKLLTNHKKSDFRNSSLFRNNTGKIALLIVAIFLSAYFLSQVGYVNYVTGGAVHSQTFDYYKMQRTSDPIIQAQFYDSYTPEQDVYSASWLAKYHASSVYYSDIEAGAHVLVSEGLIPMNQILPLTNTTQPTPGNVVYLDSLNVLHGVVPNAAGFYKTSQVLASTNQGDLVYSNGNSEIFSIPG
jgi:uncharacterized membrane protein